MKTTTRIETPFSRLPVPEEIGGQVRGRNYRDRLRAYHLLVEYWRPMVDPSKYDRLHRFAADVCDI